MSDTEKLSRRQFLKISALGATVGAYELFSGRFPKPIRPFSLEHLRILEEVTPEPLLDPRFVISHMNGQYPDIRNFFDYGLRIASNLGFQGVEVEFSSMDIQDKYRVDIQPEGLSLAKIAIHPMFSRLFSYERLKNIFITCEPSRDTAVNVWDLHNNDKFTKERLEATFKEFFDFACILHQTNKKAGKNIVLHIPNELDWHLIKNRSQNIDYSYTDAPVDALVNAITFVDTFLSAVRLANNAYKENLPLLTVVEVNKVKDALDGKKRAINNVIPLLSETPTFIGYSCYDTFFDFDASLFKKAITYVKSMSKTRRFLISEIGVPENVMFKRDKEIEDFTRKQLVTAFAEGAEYVSLWQIFDNECSARNPTSNQCMGYGIVRPDGSLSPVYNTLKSFGRSAIEDVSERKFSIFSHKSDT